MGMSTLPSRLIGLAIVGVVMVAGIVVALADAGLPLPVVLLAAAMLISILAIIGAGVVGFRSSRREGGGFWRSVGSGARTSVRTVFDLF